MKVSKFKSFEVYSATVCASSKFQNLPKSGTFRGQHHMPLFANVPRNLLKRLATVDPKSVATTIVSYEEQMRGWMSYTAKGQTETQLIEAYQQLKRQLQNYCAIPVMEFDVHWKLELLVIVLDSAKIDTDPKGKIMSLQG